jgi:hypothetical protein
LLGLVSLQQQQQQQQQRCKDTQAQKQWRDKLDVAFEACNHQQAPQQARRLVEWFGFEGYIGGSSSSLRQQE